METITEKNITIQLLQEIAWLETIIDTSVTLYFKNESPYGSVQEIKPPPIENEEAGYAQLLRKYDLSFEERVILILALIPHIKPQCLDVFLIKNKNIDTEFSEFGGLKDSKHVGFIPTIETACFIVGGADDMAIRLRFMKKIHKDHFLYRDRILQAEKYPIRLQEKLELSEESLHTIITGKEYVPTYSSRFPAQSITTKLSWEDLIVAPSVREQLDEIQQWLQHSDLILRQWGLNRSLKPGFRVLFYGSPGTGKTLAATLLGKTTNTPVFRIDLSMIVSKYIGETEKNLGHLFDEAASKDWILFFDEADALFSKRTQTNSSNDRHANQEVAYLLQRIEDFDGLVILATNLQSNIDEAFLRRFQITIDFPKPTYKERKLLWQNMVGSIFEIEEGADVLDTIAKEYELSGGEMINVVRYCAIKAASRGEKRIMLNTIMKGIKREYSKSNKTFN
ncbi:ATP-binding protein [Aquimarina sp. RZ0]|uniref:ATP-binding protein n=1 Tax=Aquimarina sp. RZ0 TaxID=2607730 RepID=UPI0011F21A66|nr:ATP-binding protein [Aquimarina sp. RZ0]KAA1247759.1 ATP-binding protein [Aquimarina sp. RZ0]